MSHEELPHIIVVGGGAGGLELVTRLGRKLGKRNKARITLVDCDTTHIWKPLLHEVAAGTFDSYENQIEFMAQGAKKHFRFRLGRLEGIDREKRIIHVAPTFNEEGEQVIPPRTFQYDLLVIAVGSISNDFGIEGVKEHCMMLDSTSQAERFQKRLLQRFLKVHTQGHPPEPGQLDIAICGAGATGVELAAQLHKVRNLLKTYGLDQINPDDIHITIVEGADRILPGLPPRLSQAAHQQLQKLGIRILTGERVVRATAEAIHTESGKVLPAGIKVWAAGIKAPDFLSQLDGLESNRIHQLVVEPTLQTTRDERIFALGDCAQCPWPGQERPVPPRAQAAHQQASLLYRNLIRKLRGQPLLPFRYRDYGSLVSLGKYSTVGNLMSNLTGSVMIEGYFARLMYLSLYKMHQVALFGFFPTLLISMSHFFKATINPEMKLH